MGRFDPVLGDLSIDPLVVAVCLPTLALAYFVIYQLYLHPLSHLPGPIIAKITPLWLWYHSYIGDEASTIHALHETYGSLLQVSPNEVDISDADAIQAIYVTKGGFKKADCYGNFDIDGHKTIFSTTDVEYRTPRAKAVVPLFSTKSIRENEGPLYGCVDRMVERMKEDKKMRGRSNVLNLTRSLAVDAVSTHLFRENYNGTSEKGSTLSASAFVDAFVAVGRFFYLPNWLFVLLEWSIEKIASEEKTEMSMAAVDKFVDEVVEKTEKGPAPNYPGRLIEVGLERTEVKAQCKDLIFAGTDSTGMNLATICRQLALHPDKLEILRKEVLRNASAGPQKQEIQSLPYLSAVIREALRLSMANPTRLPHVVPPGGWSFEKTYFPPGTLVGCSAYELHLNPRTFPNPFTFKPERWLDGNVTAEANKSFFAFGAGSRACIARNLAMTELYMATERLVLSDVLRGAKPVQKEVKIYEWFNSSVKGEKIELSWE
ncbi:cytochrome P450 [Tricladium varicosporioides]|nr:cytochrome P450 [Hymenoscyphus varicosporioides]